MKRLGDIAANGSKQGLRLFNGNLHCGWQLALKELYCSALNPWPPAGRDLDVRAVVPYKPANTPADAAIHDDLYVTD
jgi:hypothetical protein